MAATKNPPKLKRSPDLNLKGKPTPEIIKYRKLIRSNVEEPKRGKKIADTWDHLIAALDKGNALAMPGNIGKSVARRAKMLGYVIRIKKLDDEFVEIWCGGFEGVPKQMT